MFKASVFYCCHSDRDVIVCLQFAKPDELKVAQKIKISTHNDVVPNPDQILHIASPVTCVCQKQYYTMYDRAHC